MSVVQLSAIFKFLLPLSVSAPATQVQNTVNDENRRPPRRRSGNFLFFLKAVRLCDTGGVSGGYVLAGSQVHLY